MAFDGLLVVTDNANTFNIFLSLIVQPQYNSVLISAIDVILRCDIDLHIIYILEALNHVVNALS